MHPSPPAPLVPLDWSAVLENVQNSLARAEAEAARQEELLAAGPAGEPALAAVNEALARPPAWPASPEGRSAEVEASLAAAEEALRGWLAAAEETRRKLAEWASSSVR